VVDVTAIAAAGDADERVRSVARGGFDRLESQRSDSRVALSDDGKFNFDSLPTRDKIACSHPATSIHELRVVVSDKFDFGSFSAAADKTIHCVSNAFQVDLIDE
jgi:hypothetical protein